MVPVRVAARLRLPNAVVLDLRTNAELAAAPAVCHGVGLDVATPTEAPGAVKAAVQSGQIPDDKFTPLILYCRSGRRSGFGCEKLIELGYTVVVNGGSRANMEVSCKIARETCTRLHPAAI